MNQTRRKCTATTTYSGTPCRRQTAPTDKYCVIHKIKNPQKPRPFFKKRPPTHPAQIN